MSGGSSGRPCATCDGIQLENVSDEQVKAIFRSIGSGELTKESIGDVFSWLAKNECKNVREAAEALELKMLSQDDLEKLVDRVIAQNKQTVEKQGKSAFGLVMGLVMKEARGKASPEAVSGVVKEKLK